MHRIHLPWNFAFAAGLVIFAALNAQEAQRMGLNIRRHGEKISA
jgi:hypothetical protein